MLCLLNPGLAYIIEKLILVMCYGEWRIAVAYEALDEAYHIPVKILICPSGSSLENHCRIIILG